MFGPKEDLMGEKEFLARLGFQANPFQFTNADEEDHLQSYFVPPPYFDSVWGIPINRFLMSYSLHEAAARAPSGKCWNIGHTVKTYSR
jgi:hypothetical protein